MSTLLLGSNFAGEAPSDDGDVRSTITVIDHTSPDATAERRPDYNTVEHDPDTEGGLTTRNVSDFVTPSTRSVPAVGNANTDFAAPINRQVSSSGTAAAREMRGEWGHGTGYSQDATEPTIREGAQFDNVYFAAERPPIQDGSLDYMESTRQPDSKTAQDNQQASIQAARRASQNAVYERFLQERTG
jgi:hypothetical protein